MNVSIPSVCPRQDSNLHTTLRRPDERLYPLGVRLIEPLSNFDWAQEMSQLYELAD
jgi:hypothetical protein